MRTITFSFSMFLAIAGVALFAPPTSVRADDDWDDYWDDVEDAREDYWDDVRRFERRQHRQWRRDVRDWDDHWDRYHDRRVRPYRGYYYPPRYHYHPRPYRRVRPYRV